MVMAPLGAAAPAGSGEEPTPRAQPWRPVQYLGSKLRSLDVILDAVEAMPGVAIAWDPFCGSSVVSQGLASLGLRVVAGDTQAAAVTFARALLGVNRAPSVVSAHTADALMGVLRSKSEAWEHPRAWSRWVEAEDTALRAGDAQALLALGNQLPQRWRAGVESVEAASAGGPMSTTFAGTYFGVGQSARLDAIRASIGLAAEDGSIDAWHEAALLTALAHAASAAVFSAGKHFAQPLTASKARRDFLHKRLLQDRSVDIDERFLSALAVVLRSAPAAEAGHAAHMEDATGVTAEVVAARGIDVAYLDPPYTAQQYSRFYHVLETLVTGTVAPLQSRRGRVTSGLYPTGRYLSPFSSKRKATDAFRNVVGACASGGASVVVSYSFSEGRSTGNQRMVTLEQLTDVLKEFYRPNAVRLRPLTHAYRQFNSGDTAAASGRDTELLLTATAR